MQPPLSPLKSLAVFALFSLLTAKAPAQVISDFYRFNTPTPTWKFGEPGDEIQIIGTGFTGVTAVGFGGTQIAIPNPVADTQINVNVPLGALTGPISLTKGGNTVFSSAIFTVIGPEPYIVSISTNVAAQGTAIRIVADNVTENNFSIITNLSFNGVPAAGGNVFPPYQIDANVPANGVTGPIILGTFYGSTDSGTNLFYFPPVITGFTPSNGPVGTTVTVNGRNFTGLTQFRFAPSASATVSNLSNTNFTTVVPATARSGKLFLSAPAGGVQSSNDFIIPPTLESFTPAGGPVGTLVTLRGNNFFSVSNVTFSGVAASFGTNTQGTNVTATVPAGTTLSGPIVVTTAAGAVTSAVPFYLPPQLNGFTPTAGRAGTNVTLTGANFGGTTNVTFNGVDATFLVVSETSLTAAVPAGATTGRIAVRNPGGAFTNAGNFGIVPLINGFNPASGYFGDAVVITGTNFLPSPAVRFNGLTAAITAAAAGQITALVPTNATSGPIEVITAGGSDSFGTFAVVAPQILLSIRITNQQAVVSWPTNPSGFQLQVLTNLATNGSWTTPGGAAAVVGNRFTVTNDTAATNRFYRLVR